MFQNMPQDYLTLLENKSICEICKEPKDAFRLIPSCNVHSACTICLRLLTY